MKKIINLFAFLALMAVAGQAHGAVATFDDNYLTTNSHWGGAGSGATGFTSGNAYFTHTADTYSWSGFVYSNMTDTTTAGYTNQFSAITGGGVNGSANYCVSYVPMDWESGTYDPIPQTVSLTGSDYNTTVSGAYFTNTTYAYLSMRDGDWVGKKFGGATGNDEDWFKLIIKGISSEGGYTGSVDFFLADFRSSDNSLDYIVDQWTWVDLNGLGNVIGLEFSVDSSDAGLYGINTPAYFAMDDLNGSPSTVPVPAAVWLFGSGLIGLIGIRRRGAAREV